MKTSLCLSLCLLSLISSMAAYEDCSKVDSADVDRCRMQVRRLFELKDEFFKKCCADSNKRECPNACNKLAHREATEAHKAELKDDRSLSSTHNPVEAIILEDRISLGPNRVNFQIFSHALNERN